MPRRIAFTKMHGAGNDFIVIDDRGAELALPPKTIAALCARHRGIGADGLVLVRRAERADFLMMYYNSDGGEASLCGNGARCAARFAFDRGIAGRAMSFETGAGRVEAEVLDDAVRIRVPDVTGLRIGLALPGSALPVHFGVCGVPHAVIVVEDAARIPRGEFLALARAVRWDPAFGPAGANVNLASLRGAAIAYRTYERGIEDETLACGTGGVVVSAVAARLGIAAPPVALETVGGDRLEVSLEASPDGARRCVLSGPAVVSFEGTADLDGYGGA